MSSVDFTPIEHLLCVLHNSGSKYRRIFMLKAFMDESGHSDDPACNFVGMGGIVADENAWISFDGAWRNALNDFIGGQPFHMKDFVRIPAAGMYEGWKEEKRRMFLDRLVKAILESGCKFVGCVVSVPDFNQLPIACKTSLIDPYYIAFQTVTRGASLIAENGMLSPPGEVGLVYSQQKEYGTEGLGRAQQLWHTLQREADYGKWMAAYSSADPKKVFGLQAADLFAYELTQEYEHFFENPRRPMRWPMKQFVKKEGWGLMVKFYCRETMLTNLFEPAFLTEHKLKQFNTTVNDILYSRAHE